MFLALISHIGPDPAPLVRLTGGRAWLERDHRTALRELSVFLFTSDGTAIQPIDITVFCSTVTIIYVNDIFRLQHPIIQFFALFFLLSDVISIVPAAFVDDEARGSCSVIQEQQRSTRRCLPCYRPSGNLERRLRRP